MSNHDESGFVLPHVLYSAHTYHHHCTRYTASSQNDHHCAGRTLSLSHGCAWKPSLPISPSNNHQIKTTDNIKITDKDYLYNPHFWYQIYRLLNTKRYQTFSIRSVPRIHQWIPPLAHHGYANGLGHDMDQRGTTPRRWRRVAATKDG